MTNWAGVRCACCGAINASGTPAAAHQRECNGALWRTRAHAAEEETKSLREGLRYLGYAMQDGDCRRIRDRWGGNTPEDWCGEADALQGILEDLRASKAAERRAAVLAALVALLEPSFCACDGPAETVRGDCEICGCLRLNDEDHTRLRAALAANESERKDPGSFASDADVKGGGDGA